MRGCVIQCEGGIISQKLWHFRAREADIERDCAKSKSCDTGAFFGTNPFLEAQTHQMVEVEGGWELNDGREKNPH